MKSQHRANKNVLLASLIWGLTISMASWSSRWFVTDDKLFDVLWRGGDFLALILYPLLVSIILYKKTHMWVNAFLFSAVGSMMASIAMFSLRAFQGGAWTILVFGILGIWLIGQVASSRFEQIPALQREWSSPLWENLNDSSFIEFLFLQLHSISDNAG